MVGVAAFAAENYTLQFSGEIDGSEIIHITPYEAEWEHLYWGWPIGPVSLNGLEWTPPDDNTLDFSEAVIPDDLTDWAISITRNSARDAVVAEKNGTELSIYINDTPSGSNWYDFEVVLSPSPHINKTPTHELNITGTIDGSGILHITRESATWEYRAWAWPHDITMDGVSWDPQVQPTIPNSGASQFLPLNADLSTATMVKNGGRDLAAMELLDNEVLVYFADNPNGADFYDVTLSFVSELPLGDANDDGVVSADDFASVQFHFGNVYLEPGGPGDANHDGVVSADDYATVQTYYGDTMGMGGVPIPEPATLGLLAIGGVVMLRRRSAQVLRRKK